MPVYVFGATDFYDNIGGGNGENWLSKYLRKLRCCGGLFLGPYCLPVIDESKAITSLSLPYFFSLPTYFIPLLPLYSLSGLVSLKIPYLPRVTFAVGNPIAPPTDWPGKGEGLACPQALMEEMHNKEIEEFQRLFRNYKAAAGYPDADLEIL